MADNRIHLTDDGTMDTVLQCVECGEEFRYSPPEFEAEAYPHPSGDPDMFDRDAWIADIISFAEDEHECAGPGFTEPSEDDLTTEDHRTFYQYGRVAFALTETDAGPLELASVRPNHRGQYLTGTYASVEDAVRAYMEHEKWWPCVWWISDHGNWHRMEV